MACTSCSEAVERALEMVNGVKKAVVGLALEEAKVHYDPSIVDSSEIIEAIEDAGFGAELISSGDTVNKLHLKLEGMTSPKDAILIQSTLEAIQGVTHVEMDLAGSKVTVSYDADLTGPRSLIQYIEEAGDSPGSYHASLYTPPRRREMERQEDIRVYRNQFLWSGLFSVPVFMFSMVLPMISPYGDWLSNRLYNNLTMGMLLRWFFCTPVQFIIGWRYVSEYLTTNAVQINFSENYACIVILGQSNSEPCNIKYKKEKNNPHNLLILNNLLVDFSGFCFDFHY